MISFIRTKRPKNIKSAKSATVVLPIYNGVEMTKKCIESLIPGIISVPNSHLLLINDASSDANMKPMLEDLKTKWSTHITLIENEKNIGSSPSFNKGMKHAPKQDDIVFFNTDVIVPSDWLERLMFEAYSKRNIATVTPLSNSTTISTFPEFLQDNEIPFGMDVESVNAVFRKCKLKNIEAPSGIGFCMYIKRTCIDQIGYLDEKKFSRGYGEENDFCQRAIKHGWVNAITPNLYVYHKGSVSYGSEKEQLMEQANHVLSRLHPNYFNDVHKFIKRNPLKFSRLCRYADLLQSAPVTKILHVIHSWGGGSYQYLGELAKFCDTRNVASLLLISQRKGNQVVLRFGFQESADEIRLSLPKHYEKLEKLLLSLNLSGIHIHQLIDFHPIISLLPKKLGIKHIITVHDFYWLGGNPFLANEDFVFLPDEHQYSNRNQKYTLAHDLKSTTIQEQLPYLVETAEVIIFPSRSTKKLFDDMFRIQRPIVAHHLENMRNINTQPKKLRKKRKYKIAVIGAVHEHKGSIFLAEIVQTGLDQKLPFEVIIIGHTNSDQLQEMIKVTGRYEPENLQTLIREYQTDIIFFPCRWPETYSYTLSYALESGLPIIAPNLGAFPERLSGRESALLFDHLISPSTFINEMMEFINALEVGKKIFAPEFLGTPAISGFYENNYLKIFNTDSNANNNSQQLSSFHIDSIFSHLPKIREKIFHKLLNIYLHPSMAWARGLIPRKLVRLIKRFLGVSS